MRFCFIALLRILPICDSSVAYRIVGSGMKHIHHLCEQVGRTLRVPRLVQRLQHTGHTQEIMIRQTEEWSAATIRMDIPIATTVKIHIVKITAAGLAIVLQRTLIAMQHSHKMLIYRGHFKIKTAWLRCREYPLNEIVIPLHIVIRKIHNILVPMRNASVFLILKEAQKQLVVHFVRE